jgi:hypothetical protein
MLPHRILLSRVKRSLKMTVKKDKMKCYEIGNVYYPILKKLENKSVKYDAKWLKALGSIKVWGK